MFILFFKVTFFFSCKTCKELFDNLHRTPAKESVLPIFFILYPVCLKGNVTLYGAFHVRLNYHNAFWEGLVLLAFWRAWVYKHLASECSGSDSLLLAIGADLEELAPKNEQISIL